MVARDSPSAARRGKTDREPTALLCFQHVGPDVVAVDAVRRRLHNGDIRLEKTGLLNAVRLLTGAERIRVKPRALVRKGRPALLPLAEQSVWSMSSGVSGLHLVRIMFVRSGTERRGHTPRRLFFARGRNLAGAIQNGSDQQRGGDVILFFLLISLQSWREAV
jgi:hypothetical protein